MNNDINDIEIHRKLGEAIKKDDMGSIMFLLENGARVNHPFVMDNVINYPNLKHLVYFVHRGMSVDTAMDRLVIHCRHTGKNRFNIFHDFFGFLCIMGAPLYYSKDEWLEMIKPYHTDLSNQFREFLYKL